MNKYIDAERLKAEIERWICNIENCPFIEAEFGASEKREGWLFAYKKLLSFINSLQEEQQEVDLAELNWGDIESICQIILDTNRLVRERMAPDDALHYATTKEYYQEILNRFYQTRK